MKNSSWTGRAPRSLSAAFGPYVESARTVIHPIPTHRTALEEAGHTVAVVMGLVLIVALPVWCYLT